MKKFLYYVSPFILFPIISLVCVFLDEVLLVEMNFAIYAAICVFAAVVIGNLSPAKGVFDYAIPAVSAVAFAWHRFVWGFISEGDLYMAIRWATLDLPLIMCLIVGSIVFMSSFKPIRLIYILKRNKKI